jgi:hypothetical protein
MEGFTWASCAAMMSYPGPMVMEGQSKPGMIYGMGIAAFLLILPPFRFALLSMRNQQPFFKDK